MRSVKGLAMMTFSFFLCSTSVYAATITASSCSQADVGTAVTRAGDGDTVVVPAGTCTWTTYLLIDNKSITLQGAGIGQTVIIDNNPGQNQPRTLLWNTKNTGGISRLSGFTFQGGSSDPYIKGMVVISGTSQQFRVDHVRFVATYVPALMLSGFQWGVVDHCTFDLADWLGGIVGFHSDWNNQSLADGSWADVSGLGSGRAYVIEDNTFSAPGLAIAHEGYAGERVIFRYNKLNNTIWANHGTESNGRARGGRTFEIYNNTFVWTGSPFPEVIGPRSGVGVVFNNTVTSAPGMIARVVSAHNFRSDGAYAPWGKCDGTSAWDQNTPGMSGYACLDQVGRGQSDLLTGVTPINTVTGTATWPRQLPEPTYAWNNMLNSVVSPMLSETAAHIVEERDFFNTSKPGYTPYTYPHPLVSPTTAPTAPGILQVR